MVFLERQEENGWIRIDYASTWNYGYDFMLDATQVIIDTDLKENLHRVAVGAIAGAGQTECLKDVVSSRYDLRNCNSTKNETGVLMIAGLSKLMNCSFQLVFYNQTRVVRLQSAEHAFFKENGEHVFDNYLNSAEIQAYCRATERQVIERLQSQSSVNDSK